jgi:hypothetical protein
MVLGLSEYFETRLPAFAKLRRAWVSLVAGNVDFVLLDLPCQKFSAASAYGATAFRHTIAVSASSTASCAINRQFLLARSKNHSLRRGPRCNQSKTYASTSGLTGSIRPQAKRSRFGLSLCKTPRPGSRPSSAAASRRHRARAGRAPYVIMRGDGGEFLLRERRHPQAINQRLAHDQIQGAHPK